MYSWRKPPASTKFSRHTTQMIKIMEKSSYQRENRDTLGNSNNLLMEKILNSNSKFQKTMYPTVFICRFKCRDLFSFVLICSLSCPTSSQVLLLMVLEDFLSDHRFQAIDKSPNGVQLDTQAHMSHTKHSLPAASACVHLSSLNSSLQGE